METKQIIKEDNGNVDAESIMSWLWGHDYNPEEYEPYDDNKGTIVLSDETIYLYDLDKFHNRFKNYRIDGISHTSYNLLLRIERKTGSI